MHLATSWEVICLSLCAQLVACNVVIVIHGHIMFSVLVPDFKLIEYEKADTSSFAVWVWNREICHV